MTRILKPVSGRAVDYLDQICAQYFREARGLHIVEHNLGNAFTGRIDLLATDHARVFLVTIGTGEFAGSLLRSFMGYRWFRENREFLQRIYSAEEIDVTLPPCLVILSQDIPVGTAAMCRDICTVPVSLCRYRLFGSEDDPDISIEGVAEPDRISLQGSSLDELRKDLGIEHAGLTDQEIRDFRAAMGF
ncbi:MAG: hypothetical protein WDA72_11705 [Desulfomonilia bacterium]|nr:hypothetical protein [Deltaproteobacteria bacterium]HPW67859.1 hypothetical protein [Deltaproteobacteria bacterium]